jgi:precorrin-6x reductase
MLRDAVDICMHTNISVLRLTTDTAPNMPPINIISVKFFLEASKIMTATTTVVMTTKHWNQRDLQTLQTLSIREYFFALGWPAIESALSVCAISPLLMESPPGPFGIFINPRLQTDPSVYV